ncbi:MAG: hypothetical protein R3E65_09375 [Steroidobacteraceae bacterium]
MTTSAALLQQVVAGADSVGEMVAMLQGQTIMVRGAPEPLATGDVHSSSPNTRSWPSAALNSDDR